MKLTFVIFCLTTIVASRQIPANDNNFAANQEIVKKSAVPQDTYDNSCFEASSDEEEDGIIIDGDILVSKEQAAIFYESGWDGLVNSEAWENTKRWGKNIPYKISYSDKEMKDNPTEINKIVANVKSSMKAIEDKTGCIKFSKASCTDFIKLKFNIGKDRKCYTKLGRPIFGNRDISLGYNCAGTPCRAMTPAHEIMHTMGRHHEQNRPDRDTYVTIYSKNTCPTQMKIEKGAETKGIAYDYYSVMHYSPAQCATTTHLSFSIKKANIHIHNIGQRKLLTDKDIQHIKAIHCSSMMMRLVGGRDNSEGRLEVNNEEVWGTVCSDGFDRNDANVVCKYLGRPGVEEVYSAADIQNIQSAQDSPIWLSDLECTGLEDNPFFCSQKVMKHHTNCDHNQDVAIRCSKAARLIGGNGNSGRLEVYHEGKWGSACSHKFGYPEANVACRMMGYSSAVQVFTNEESEYDDTVDNKIVVSQLKCDGTENHLSDCYIRHAHICHGGKPVYLECSNY